jgi:hypothetical protein
MLILDDLQRWPLPLFRYSFIDALRLAGVPGEINIALAGHTDV